MTTYNTMNPVPSADARDRFDNSQVFDEYITGTDLQTPDRMGVMRKTLTGLENDFNNFLIQSGFEPVHLVYVDGQPLQVDRATQLIDRDGAVYRVKMPSSFPVMLTGDWATDLSVLVEATDQSLRAELGGGVRRVESIDQLSTLPGRFEGDVAFVVGYYSDTPGSGNTPRVWRSTSTKTDNRGNIIQVTGVATGRWEFDASQGVWAEDFGARPGVAYIAQTTAAIMAAKDSLRANQIDILSYIGGPVVQTHSSGELRLGLGHFYISPDVLDITGDMGLVLKGQGGRGTNQAVLPPTALVVHGTSSGFGMRMFGNGARYCSIVDMDFCYYDSNFTGALIDVLACPGFSVKNCRLGCFGGTAATRVQSAASLVRASYDEFLLFDRVVFDGAIRGWFSDDIRSLGGATFGGSKTRFRDCLFYDILDASIYHSGARPRLGLVIDNCGFNPINVSPAYAINVSNVDGFVLIGGIAQPSGASTPATNQWTRLLNITGSIDAFIFGTGAKAGTISGMVSINGTRIACDDGLTLAGGVISGKNNKFSSGTRGFSLEPTTPLAVDIGPDIFSSAVTNSYSVPAASALLSGRINYNANNDTSTGKSVNLSANISFENIDRTVVQVPTLPATISNMQSGRLHNVTAAGTVTLQAPMLGVKFRVQKQGATALTISPSVGSSFITGATGTRTSAVATAGEVGSCLEFEAFSANLWLVTVVRGGWSFT